MRVRGHGKYTKMNLRNPEAIGTCDVSGFMVRRADMVEQLRYVGSGQVSTKLLVNPKFYSVPNPQELVPRIKVDPKPIFNPRPNNIIDNQLTIATSIGILNIDVSPSVDVTISVPNFMQYGSFNFIGALTADITVFVPNLMKNFYANNLTTGDFTLSLQLEGNISTTPPLIISAASSITLLGPLIGNTFINLQIINL